MLLYSDIDHIWNMYNTHYDTCKIISKIFLLVNYLLLPNNDPTNYPANPTALTKVFNIKVVSISEN